ncbi:hypothetical protein AZF37_02215 [endosymbiont 'TC1' of Trimyema compressum]|uniref:hypothetical protein n=1 Tax=endosymbiont 'TC1' of Trimyema compressum TaxID=243899 RepID=UPI0007F09B0C|nr:hypothetical protein [endosymbiont 'TC1' of Trimyema compressum]AMP20143.1 hypothetical protein AZF37_02215 [endosymbiont 'TC1' of Trimyema compressum]
MNIRDDFAEIMNYAHFRNWLPDLGVVQNIYDIFPQSFAVLTPFAYTHLEEFIRSTTSKYGIVVLDESGNPKHRKVGKGLIELAINENKKCRICSSFGTYKNLLHGFRVIRHRR